MGSTDTVTVYSFRVFEGSVERSRVMGFKATRETIHRRFDGEVMESTAEAVDVDDIDECGCYVRVPTGWGALGPQ